MFIISLFKFKIDIDLFEKKKGFPLYPYWYWAGDGDDGRSDRTSELAGCAALQVVNATRQLATAAAFTLLAVV